MSNAQEVYQEKMRKTLHVLKTELNTVRAGRANAALLDQIQVDYYGTPTPLKNLSNISVPDPRTLLITPFDPKSVGDIEKAIMTSNLGINPSNDGKSVRLAIPQLTEERRKDLTKIIKRMGEEAKVAVRNCRRDANDELKKLEKKGELTEDDLKNDLDDVQKRTDKCMTEIDEIVSAKEKELMEI
ncbi:MAG: ribosome recycling factor [Bacillota bacterium]|jgi:ribosome recycling factor|nr:ribosome recycling factor [Eubacteriales bacterium]MDI9491313.1 ribosome recycling factor [Bacillota bacterium]NLV70710.1 ribosome recycling factor [Clostridiales bacterium]HRV33566.1 ribosome recycling factor [Anaerovoracaceae bacterium]MDD3537330.1 ribosome recycling factor [Eubacteriales bacterium]